MSNNRASLNIQQVSLRESSTAKFVGRTLAGSPTCLLRLFKMNILFQSAYFHFIILFYLSTEVSSCAKIKTILTWYGESNVVGLLTYVFVFMKNKYSFQIDC